MKRLIIIGSGVGGLVAGIYGQLMGFETIIYEAHTSPGGQCTSWERKGYIFDGCLHHFGGFAKDMKFYDFWETLGVVPCEKVDIKACVSAISSDGVYFHDYYDLERLESHMKALSPEDSNVIDAYINSVKMFQKGDPFGTMILGNLWDKIRYIPYFIKRATYFNETLESFGRQFKHPLLSKAFPLLHYSLQNVPLFFYNSKHVAGEKGGMAWPMGGSSSIAQNMVNRYQSLGGTIHCGEKVQKILTENGYAKGVMLEDQRIDRGDYVISNADGRKTIKELLSGQFINRKIDQYCELTDDIQRAFAVQVFFGVNRNLSNYPSSLIMFLDKEEEIAGHKTDHLDIQVYGNDMGMAPEGKGVIKVELFSKYSYFNDIHLNEELYKQEKQRIASQVLKLLNQHFYNIASDVEVVDVVTLHTWERFMGGTMGYDNFPKKKFSIINAMFGINKTYTLPKLKRFYFVGGWVTSAGALVLNAKSGKRVIQKICKETGIKFIPSNKNAWNIQR